MPAGYKMMEGADYYRGVSRFVLFAVLTAALLVPGCNRGRHPDLIGKAAPTFRVQDEDRTVALSDLHGKVVILNFWASWCQPCVEETPSLIAMQDQLQGNVTVFAVSTDESRSAYLNFIRDYKTNFLTVRDPAQNSSNLYGTFGYPESYIIDRNGIIRRKVIGPIDWTKPEMIAYLTGL